MRDIFTEIWESIRRNKLRTALTGFAVSWGIFMLIVLLGAGNGLMNSFMRGSEGFATNSVEVGGGWTSMPYDGLKAGRRIRLDEGDITITAGELFDQNVDIPHHTGHGKDRSALRPLHQPGRHKRAP